jgi:hypothetical protein
MRSLKYYGLLAVVLPSLLLAISDSSPPQSTGQGEGNTEGGLEAGPDSSMVVRVPLLRPFHYNSGGKRDPFVPLITKNSDDRAPSIASLTLTGIIWNRNESLAVLEDTKGMGYPMRVGDRLGNATLVGIRDDAVIFRVVLYGVVHMHTLKLQSEEEM